MQSYIPKYNYKFPTNLPKSDKGYALTYIRQMISEFVYDMGSLENNPFTFPEVQNLLDGVTVGGHKLSDQNQILNIKSSWDYVIKLSNKENINIDKDTICSIHKIIAKDEALIVGDFRNGAIGIAGTTNYKCIEASSLVDIFIKDINVINSIKNPLEKAIIINLWLSYCKFFYDGNKRTARLTSNLILMNGNIGVFSIPAKYKQVYNTLMLNFYETLEADEVIKFFLEKCITFFDGFNYKNYSELIE